MCLALTACPDGTAICDGVGMLAGLAIFSSPDRQQRFDFRFSQGAFRDDEIFDSATSTPSRYLLEIGRRLSRATFGANWFAIGNPLLPLGSALLEKWLVGVFDEPVVVTDKSNFPIVYLLPRRLFEERENLLLALSCVDGLLDARVLSVLSGAEVICRTIDLDRLDAFPPMSANGWANPHRQLRVLRVQAEKALHLMQVRSDWSALPLAIFQPHHHASDALFAALASKQVPSPLYGKQVIHTAFKEIVEACLPALLPIELAPISSGADGSLDPHQFFVGALERLGEMVTGENYVIFAHYLRAYQATPFHLVDHAKFTLGDSMESIQKTLYGQPSIPVSLCGLPAKPLKILFHLNGSGALKTYPLEKTRILFDVLKGLGCELTVLDRPDLEAAGARSVAAGTLSALKAAIDIHHLFVGVDAYPLHFAKLVMGRPAIALFGNSKPCNRDAPRRRDYRALVSYLPCDSACLTKQVCPIFGSVDCQNFVRPQTAASELVEMAHEYYGFYAG